MKQKAAITFELEETVVLKHGGRIVADFCPRCNAEVEMLSPDVLSLLAGTSEREIFRLMEAGKVHFVEVDRICVCPGCYQRAVSENEPPKTATAIEGEKQ